MVIDDPTVASTQLECINYNFKQTLDILPGIWYVLDRECRFIYYNKAFAKSCGLDNEADDFLIGITRDQIPLFKLLPGKDYLLSDELVLTTKKLIKTLNCIPNYDESWILWEVIKSPILSSDGEVEAMIFHCIDQSANRNLDLALSYEQKHICYNSPIKAKKEIVNLSPLKYEALFYLTRGFSYQEIADKLKVSYRTVVDYIERLKIQLKATTTTELISKSLALGYMDHIPKSFVKRPMFINILDNKSISKKNELHSNMSLANINFRQTLDLLPGAWAVLDTQSRFIYYNDQYLLLMIGNDKMPKDFLIGETTKKLPNRLSKHTNCFMDINRIIINTKKTISILYCLEIADNQWLLVQANKAPVFNSDNEVEAIICQFIDQTENNALDLAYALSKECGTQEDNDDNNSSIFYITKGRGEILLKDDEYECLFYLIRGYSYKEIARRQKVSYRTIIYRLEHLKSKFKVITTRELISEVLTSGYVNSIPKNLFSQQMSIILQD